MIVKSMTEQQCMEFVAKSQVGFLACAKDNMPYVVPIHYVLEIGTLYLFSMPGQKTQWLQDNPNACLLVEKITDDHNWKSVLIRGTFTDFTNDPTLQVERDKAWNLLKKRNDWWEPGAITPASSPVREHRIPIFFSISIHEITGRHGSEA